MFQPETEDMLPRTAPKPSSNLGSNHISVRPMVPEVSILFGQQGAVAANGAAATQMPVKPVVVAQQTYAAWKRKVLPKVNFPPELMDDDNRTSTSPSNRSPSAEYEAAPRSNLYPLRTATATVSPLVTTSTDCLQYQRRSLESSPPIYASSSSPQDYGYTNVVAYPQQQQQQRRSVETLSQHGIVISAGHDVLTICAGTQTDAVGSISSPDSVAEMQRNFASKHDVGQLLAMLQDMRGEQLRLTQICEELLVQKRNKDELPSRTYHRDVGTQYESTVIFAAASPRRPLREDYIDEEEELAYQQRQQQQQVAASNAYNNQLKQPAQPIQFQTPRAASPVAHSTRYRVQAPRPQRPVFVAQNHQQQPNIATVLPKPATEQSMVMNKLALKYLPNEKLGELMQELHMSPGGDSVQTQQPATPLRQIENFEKCANDISNASYKYLKKYRLLPEDNDGDYQTSTTPRTQSPMAAVMRQQQQQQSPYHQQQNAGCSPLAMAGGENGIGQEQLLDLDRLRNQPKFV